MKIRRWDGKFISEEFEFNQPVVRLGRDARCDVCFNASEFPKVSGLHAELRWDGQFCTLVHRSKSNSTLLNGEAINRPQRIAPGDRVRLGFTGPEIELVQLDAATPPSSGQASSRRKPIDGAKESNVEPPATMMAGKASDYLAADAPLDRFEVNQGGIIGRDTLRANFVLDHPQVSRLHAQLRAQGDKFMLADLGSANGTFCNGKRITAPLDLSIGDTLDIGPYSLVFDGRWLTARSRSDNMQLVVSSVSFTLQDANRRKPLKLLDHVDFVLDPGEFLCILGPSGSGKSTLLNVISGRRTATSGQVLVNGRDLHRNFAALKHDVSVVPQSSTLHDSLTVEQSFRFTSELRLPADLSRSEINATVSNAIATVGLVPRRAVQISKLSGGQLKRAGLGGELLADPSLLFLDEVTSGLDEQSDGEMMRLFRSLADGGKTLVCITHNLAHVEDNCHLVAVLTVGGKLAFFGSPPEAKSYFGINRLADIYTQLAMHSPEHWHAKFRDSSLFSKYVTDRKPTPSSNVDAGESARDEPAGTHVIKQFSVLLRRIVAVWSSNRVALGALFGQALLVAILLCLVFGQLEQSNSQNPLERAGKIRNLLFLLSVSCIWLGCNNGVKEIVKERSIFDRERNYGLIPEAFLGSKFVFLSVIGIFQSQLLGLIALLYFGMPGSVLGMLGTLAMSSLAGTALGLAISAHARTEETAVALVPIVIIPQIILAGVVAALPTFCEWLARTSITAYWSQQAIESCLPELDRIPAEFQPAMSTSLGMILLHGLVFSLIAWLGVRWPRA